MMYHPMKRAEQALSPERCREILEAAEFGVLSLAGADGVPYGVPVNYAMEGGRLWFHCGPEGRKLDLLRENPRVSFCVVGTARLVPEEFTTRFESVIVSGKARIPETREEKLEGMMAICRKFSPAYLDRLNCIKGDLKGVCLVEITPEEISGKRSKSL